LVIFNFPCFMLLPRLQPLAALCMNQLDKQYSLTASLPFADRTRKTRKSSPSVKIRGNWPVHRGS
jgi:hypothetical protein